MTKSKKMGRPRKPSNQSRQPGISVRLLPDEMITITQAAKTANLSKSEWARKCLLHVITNDIGIT
jgi:hypothetical protein